jgi:DNA-directed RNA polymerase subunit M/transcription elongation factor TFIIS
MKCPKCGEVMRLEDKDTSSGRDMRTYVCDSCQEEQIVDNGIATWKAMSDAREASIAEPTAVRHDAWKFISAITKLLPFRFGRR